MPAEIYKVIHLIAIMGIFSSVVALIVQDNNGPFKKPAMIFHGVSWVLLFVSGFGMLARYDIPVLHWWTLCKMAILFFFGAVPVLIKKGVIKGVSGWGALIFVGGIAAILGVYRIMIMYQPS